LLGTNFNPNGRMMIMELQKAKDKPLGSCGARILGKAHKSGDRQFYWFEYVSWNGEQAVAASQRDTAYSFDGGIVTEGQIVYMHNIGEFHFHT